MCHKTLERLSTPKLTKYIDPSHLLKKCNILEALSTSKLTKYMDLFCLRKKIHIIKVMRNQFTEYKTLLQILSLEEQVHEINNIIKSLVNKKHIANIKDRRYDRIKELKHMRDNMINNL